MRRRSRLLRVAKWGGVVVCVLMAALWAISLGWELCVVGRTFVVSLHGGSITLGARAAANDPIDKIATNARVGFHIVTHRSKAYGPWPHFRSALRGRPMILGLRLQQADPAVLGVLVRSYVFLPLWLPLALLIGLLTVQFIVARCWPRPIPGHCPCGYDLRGNESGVCPECGIDVQS